MEHLTTRQRELLKFLVQFTCRKLYQPSSREICDALGINSTNAIRCHLDALRRKGYVEFNVESPRARALHFTDKALDYVDLSDPTLRVMPAKKVVPCRTS